MFMMKRRNVKIFYIIGIEKKFVNFILKMARKIGYKTYMYSTLNNMQIHDSIWLWGIKVENTI